jgi:(R,R)-butanediol dehydrogenase / meso-butanediol dehydrogenase / diacetyl reductase
MRSALYQGNRTFTVEDRAGDPPGPDQVRIKVAYTGICGTDLHILHGAMDHRVAPSTAIGHEMSGRIVELGSAVTEWQLGDPVTVMPLDWCGKCPACRAGNSHICQNLNFVGIDSPGSMCESWTVPASLLVRLPADLPLDRAALVEPTAVAVHDVRRSGLVAGEKAVVVGGGPVGLLIACVATGVGAEVVVVELDATRRQVATQLGLRVLDPAATDVAAFVQEWTETAGAQVVFEVSGSAPGVTMAVDLLAVRGRLVVVGIHPVPREVSLHRVFWRELSLIGARVYQRTDFEEAVRLVHSGQVPADLLISRVVPIEQVADAFTALETGGVVKVLVACSPEGDSASD